MNRKSTPIPEPIVQLQRRLEQFRSTQSGRTKLNALRGTGRQFPGMVLQAASV